jgi:hypothetical protein
MSSTGCLTPQPFAAGGKWSYPNLWAVTGDPRYKIPIVALEPFVERVVGAFHLTGGRIGTHMLLQVPPQDSVVRPWG